MSIAKRMQNCLKYIRRHFKTLLRSKISEDMELLKK